jgi:MoaA/NifB/PqqE/SkfB family radical SAM enzyme
MYYVNPLSLANKILNRLEIKARRTRLISRPIEITLEPTLMCDSNCLMCNRNFFRKEDRNVRGLLDWKTLEAVRPFFRFSERVVFSGFGEPLLHPEFLKMAAAIKKEGPDVLFFTNALDLTEKLAQGLVEADLDFVYVSLGGASRETYKKVRGVDGFDRVVANVEALTRAKKAMNKKRPSVRFNVVAMASVLDELDEIVSLAGRVGVEAVDMPNMVAHGESIRGESLWLQPERAAKALAGAASLAERLGIEFRSPGLAENKLDCRHFFTSFYVAWDGDVLTCPMERYVVGNVKDQAPSAIWNGLGLVGLRKAYFDKGLASTCPKCPCWDYRPDTFFDSWPNSRRYAERIPPCP